MINKFTRYFTLILSLFLLPVSFQPLLAAEAESATPTIEKVSINIADADHLSMLKGIGMKKAKAIIKYRTDNGSFVSLQDLIKVKGIGQATLKKLMPYLTL